MESGRALQAALIAALALPAGIGCGPEPRSSGEAGAIAAVDSLLAEAERSYLSAEYDSAAARFEQARGWARQHADPAAEARATYGLGRVAYGRDDYPAAARLVGQALEFQRRYRLDDQLFDSHNLLSLIAYYEGRYFDAIDWAARATELGEAEADTARLLKAWTSLALSHTELGDFAQARQLLQKALVGARVVGNDRSEGRVLINLGMLAVRTGEPSLALEHLEAARAKAIAAGDVEGELNLLGQMGTAWAAIGEPGRAIAILDSAARRARDLELPQEEASNLEHLAGVYHDAGEYPRALRLLDDARAINDRTGLRDESAANLRRIAEIHLALGNVGLARRSAAAALELHRAVGNRMNVLQDLFLLARIASETGDHAAAAAHLDEAAMLAEALDVPTARGAVALAVARAADRAGDGRRVLGTLRAAAADLATSGIDREWESHWLVARAQAQAGRLDAAAMAGRRAVAALDRIRGGFGSDALRSSFLAERDQVHLDLAGALLALGRVEEAFEVSDAARGRALLERLATLRDDGGPSVRELAEEERQLLRQIDSTAVRVDQARRRGEGERGSHRVDLDRLYRELERIRADYTAALVRTEEGNPAVAALAGSAVPSARAIRAALDPDEALLEWLVGPEQVHLFVATRDGVRVYSRTLERGSLTTRVRVVRQLLGRPGTEAGPALEALHEVLLGDARRAGALAGRSRLIIIPHHELAYLPFAALRDSATHRFLVEDFALAHLPSATILPVLRGAGPRESTAGGPAIAFAPFPEDLPGTKREAEVAARALPGGRSVRGGEAREPAVRRALTDHAAVHLATHGVLNPRSPLFSRIEVTGSPGRGTDDDGRLEVHEVVRIAIGASLVFLSGCETGLGAAGATGFSTGEDYATLTRAFLQAGAGNVVATLWRIEDAGTAELVGRFYREVAEGLRRAAPGRLLPDALSRAQRQLIQDPLLRSPYYWAGFQLSGGGDLRWPGRVQGP